MNEFNFRNIRLVLGEPSTDVRFGLRTALSGAGFEKISDTGLIDVVRENVANDRADLLICDTQLENGDFSAMIQKIRHREIGNNPFVNIITLVPSADERSIRTAMSSGTDDILVMPVSPRRLLDRVVHLIHERKPFVVTTDYIGPDRRKAHRPGTQRIPRVQVPNPLRHMVSEDRDDERLKAEIREATKLLNEMKVERHAYQIVYLVEKIVQIRQTPDIEESITPNLDRLGVVSADLHDRLYGTPFAHWSERCRTLIDVMKGVRNANMEPNNDQIAQLVALARDFKSDIAAEPRAAVVG